MRVGRAAGSPVPRPLFPNSPPARAQLQEGLGLSGDLPAPGKKFLLPCFQKGPQGQSGPVLQHRSWDGSGLKVPSLPFSSLSLSLSVSPSLSPPLPLSPFPLLPFLLPFPISSPSPILPIPSPLLLTPSLPLFSFFSLSLSLSSFPFPFSSLSTHSLSPILPIFCHSLCLSLSLSLPLPVSQMATLLTASGPPDVRTAGTPVENFLFRGLNLEICHLTLSLSREAPGWTRL